MTKVTNQSNQKDLIEELFSALSSEGSVYIEVESLPYFLSSIPSIKVFQYKVQNYPKPIFWYSKDTVILEFLAVTNLPIDFPPTLSAGPVAKTIIIQSQQNQTKSEFPNINISDLPTSSKLFELKQRANQEEKIDFKQDLNSWLEKIESTKENLSRFQSEAIEQRKISQNKHKLQNKLLWIKNIIDSKWFKFSTVSICLITIGTVIALNYPTQIIKVDIAPTTKQESFNIKFTEANTSKSQVTLKANASLDTSGTKEIPTENGRATGKVALANNSNEDVQFTRDGLILVSEENGFEYRQKSTEADPKNYVVTKKNLANNNAIEIAIQSTEIGKNYDLPKNSTFRVYNLRGENMGSGFRGTATSDIKNTQVGLNRYVTEADLSLLKSKAESNLAEAQSKEIETLKTKGEFTSNSWIKILNTDYKISAKTGDQTNKIDCEATSTIEIYSVPQDKLKNSIREQAKISGIEDIKMVNSSIQDGQIIANVFLSYKENPEIFKADISSQINNSTNINQSIEQTTSNIQAQYPNIKRVSKDIQGINLPFKFPLLQPRNRVEINELQIK